MEHCKNVSYSSVVLILWELPVEPKEDWCLLRCSMWPNLQWEVLEIEILHEFLSTDS